MSVNKVNQTTGALSPIAGGTLYADMAIGTIVPYGGSVAPDGFLLCQGQSLLRTAYPELFAVIGTSFGSVDSTHFNIPDMRESVPKGAGLTGHTVGAHLDADGLAVGEFIDDRLQSHKHLLFEWSNGTGAGPNATLMWNNGPAQTTGNTTNGINEGREGNTTEVKAVGVNYIIKAKMVALPSDFASSVDDAIDAKIVDTIADGNMKAATSNAVYDMFNNPTISEYQDIQLPSNWWTDSSKAVALRIVRFGIIKAVYRNNAGIKMPYTNDRSLEGLFPAGTVRESLRPAMASLGSASFYIRNLNNETNSTYQSLQTVLLTIGADGSINGYCYNGVGVQSSINYANNPLWIYI